jgi:hypothetical protein
MNNHALGRIVATDKCRFVFISDDKKPEFAIVHDIFRRRFRWTAFALSLRDRSQGLVLTARSDREAAALLASSPAALPVAVVHRARVSAAVLPAEDSRADLPAAAR